MKSAEESADGAPVRGEVAGAPRDLEGMVDLLRRVAASAPGAVCSFVLGRDGSMRMPFAARALEDLYGVPLEVLARDFAPVQANVHAEDAPVLARAIEESARSLTPWHDVFRYRHPTRGLRSIEGWALPSREPDGSVLWHGFVMDVTARTLAEERSARLAGLYRTLLAANAAIFRSRDEGSLLRALVAAMLGLEGVKIVWVGRVDRERGAVVPEVVEGELASLIRGRDFALAADVPGGGSMPSVAARTESTVVNNAVALDERAGPVREVAVRMGVASALCAPVRCRGRVEAILTIGSKLGGFFDAEVEALFGTLALDLSRALDALADARELAASREQFRRIAEHVAVGIAIGDAEGRLVFANEALASALRVPAGDLRGLGLRELVHPEDRDQAFGRLGDARVVRAHVRLLGRGGLAVPGDFTLTRLPIGDGSLEDKIVSFVDTTEKAEREAELVESRRRLELAERIARFGWWERNLVTGEVHWSRGTYAIFERDESAGPLSGDEIRALVEPGARDRFDALTARAREGRVEGELPLRFPGGRRLELHLICEPVRSHDGSVVLIRATMQDLTERRAVEEEHRLTQNKLRAAFDAGIIGVALGTVDGRLLDANDEQLRILGVTRAELESGQFRWSQLTAPEHRDRDAAGMAEAALRGRCTPYEKDYVRRDGTRVPALVGFARVGPDRKEVVAFVHDLTDRKRTEAELERVRTQFLHAQRLEAVGRLAGAVAHDFNNLLTVIDGFTRLVLDEPTLDVKVRSSLDQVIRAATRAKGLTRQLLAFSRHLPAEVRVVDLGATVQDMGRMLRTLLGEASELVLETPSVLGESPSVRIDPGQLEQVVMNLAVNARDAMPRGGTLRLAVDAVSLGPPSPSVGANALAPGSYARLRAIDTGTGMSAAIQARLFEPFFSTKEPGKGTGLGLATVYGIVRQARGAVRVESEEGRGSTFEILLPRVEAGVEQGTEPRPAARPATGTETVLLVEDEPGVRELETAVLARGGYSVLSAATPSEALRRFETAHAPIALVLSDVILPEMSGPVLVQKLRQLSPGLPALFVSGYPGEELPESGGDRCLTKPVPPDELLRAVREEIDRGT